MFGAAGGRRPGPQPPAACLRAGRGDPARPCVAWAL